MVSRRKEREKGPNLAHLITMSICCYRSIFFTKCIKIRWNFPYFSINFRRNALYGKRYKRFVHLTQVFHINVTQRFLRRNWENCKCFSHNEFLITVMCESQMVTKIVCPQRQQCLSLDQSTSVHRISWKCVKILKLRFEWTLPTITKKGQAVIRSFNGLASVKKVYLGNFDAFAI